MLGIHIRHRPERRYTIVTAVRKGDNISYSATHTDDSERHILETARMLAEDIAENTLIAVIDWTGKERWSDGRRIAHYGAI